MTTVVYFENVETKKRYKVLGFREDGDKRFVTLQGLADPWEEPFTRERFETMGYKLVRVEEEPAS
jgi:hypothetical protein